MSTHPNAILLLCLKPDNLARKTYRAILDEAGLKDEDDSLKLGDADYTLKVMESDYLDDYQITADEGDIIALDMVTYGYGERIEWAKLEAQKNALDEWARGICERHKCTYKIYITANYW